MSIAETVFGFAWRTWAVAPAPLREIPSGGPAQKSSQTVEFIDGRIAECFTGARHRGADLAGRVYTCRFVTEEQRTQAMLRVRALAMDVCCVSPKKPRSIQALVDQKAIAVGTKGQRPWE